MDSLMPMYCCWLYAIPLCEENQNAFVTNVCLRMHLRQHESIVALTRSHVQTTRTISHINTHIHTHTHSLTLTHSLAHSLKHCRYGLGMMVELLCGVLPAAATGPDVRVHLLFFTISFRSFCLIITVRLSLS